MGKSTARQVLPKRWAARPDQEMVLMTGAVLPVVSMEAQAQAVLDGLTLQNRIGGILTVQCERSTTEVPDERVTTFLLVTWSDSISAVTRTDGSSTVTTQAEPSDSAQWEYDHGGGAVRSEPDTEPEAGFKYDPEAKAEPEAAEPDGFDYSKLEDEDVEETAEVTR